MNKKKLKLIDFETWYASYTTKVVLLCLTLCFTITGIIFYDWSILHIFIIFCCDTIFNTVFVALKYWKDEQTLIKNFAVFKFNKTLFNVFTNTLAFLFIRTILLLLFLVIIGLILYFEGYHEHIRVIDTDLNLLTNFDMHFFITILGMLFGKIADFINFAKQSVFDLSYNRIRLEENYIDERTYMLLTFIIFSAIVDVFIYTLTPNLPFSIFKTLSCCFILLKYYSDYKNIKEKHKGI